MTISQRLEAARRDLLDLSLRNQLLNHRPSKTRGLAIVDELPATTYRLLWDEERTFTFAAGTGDDEAGETAEPPAPPAPGEETAARHREDLAVVKLVLLRLLALPREVLVRRHSGLRRKGAHAKEPTAHARARTHENGTRPWPSPACSFVGYLRTIRHR